MADVLRDAASGIRMLSAWSAFASGIFLLILFVGYDPLEYLAVLALTLLVFLSTLTAIYGSWRIEQSAIAPKLVTVGAIIPFLAITALTIGTTITGGFSWFGTGLGGVFAALYAFGLARLRRPDVQEYFWSLRVAELPAGPSVLSDDDDAPDAARERPAPRHEQNSEVVLGGIGADDATAAEPEASAETVHESYSKKG